MMDITVPNAVNTRANAYRDIYERYVDEAAFLWILRSVAVNQPHYFPEDLTELEGRIQAQLDGLLSAPDLAWEVCDAMLDTAEPGEVFTATNMAFRSHEVSRIQRAVEVGLSSERAMPGLISALGWLESQQVSPWIGKFLAGKDMRHKYLGVAACSVRRDDPGEMLGEILMRDDCRAYSPLYARGLRLVGELRRQDLMPVLQTSLHDEDEMLRFWSIWSSVLLGDVSQIELMKPFVFMRGPYQQRAIQLAFRVLDVNKGREWISSLAQDPTQARQVISATGVLGDPHAVNWLIMKMQDPLLARLAGEAFSFITGIELDKHQLTCEPPSNQVPIPNDDANDTHVGMDEDENLSWPDPDKVAALWRRHGQHFLVGRRYFIGRPATPEWLTERLNHGHQRQRHAAAIELALTGSQPLPNTYARMDT